MRKIFIGFILSGILIACNNNKETASNEPKTTDDSTTKTTQQSEFADPKYVDMGKQRLQQFQSGDIDTWVGQFADNAVYLWSAGDSLAGKKAITDYWKDRRGKVIDSITFSNDIWLPLKVNYSQRGPDIRGIWLLSWYQVDAKYKTGKKLTFWTHTDFHFNSNDQIDRVIQYIDRAPIMAATK